MRKKILTAFLMVLTILAPTGFTQSGSQVSDRAELVSRCEAAVAEIKLSRRLIGEYEAAIDAAEKEISKAKELKTLSDEQIRLMELETAKVREALDLERKALKESEAALAEYKTALAKMTKKKNFFKTLAKIAIVTAGVAVGVAGGMVVRN